MAECGRTWSDREIAVLLAKWSDETIQRHLRGAVRNVFPFRAIADELRSQGFERDFKQCRRTSIVNVRIQQTPLKKRLLPDPNSPLLHARGSPAA